MMDNPNVYIVDDHEAVRDSLGALLMSDGFSVEAFASTPRSPAAHSVTGALAALRIPRIDA